MTPTRYKVTHVNAYGIADGTSALHYEKRGNDWRMLIVQTGTYGDGTAHVTGPAYRTRAELLSDLPRMAQQWGIDTFAGVQS